MLEKYPEDVKLVYKNFPLRNHKYASMASEAALSAGKQGKFWEFHDKLFENYSRLNEGKIREIAVELGLDLVRFEEGMKARDVNVLIKRDINEGSSAGVRGTPTIFVNGKLLTNRSLEGFKALIERELKNNGK